MALTDDEQELLNFALAALPSWVRKDDDALRGAAKQIGAARRQWDYWYSQTLIKQATGPTPTQPDWLNQHARDRGTNRQAGEDDPTLRLRLRNVDDSITRPAIFAAVNSILDAQGIPSECAILETPRDGAHSGTFTAETGTGGTFAAGAGTTFFLTPTVSFKRSPWRDPSVIRLVQSWGIVISGAAHSGNNGGFLVTGALGKAAQYTNASGFAGADLTAAWRLVALDRRLNFLGDVGVGGSNMAFASRGYRSAGVGKRLIIILPYGATPATTAAVLEMLRTKKAAGVAVTIETRLSP